MTASTAGILRGYLSDNAAGAPPEILEALSAAAVGPAAPYANDPLSARVRHTLAEVFEHPVDVFLVGTGSAANGISLAALTPPWGAVLAHPNAHINNDEAGAPEFFTNGAKIVGVDGPTPNRPNRAVCRRAPDGRRRPLRAAVRRQPDPSDRNRERLFLAECTNSVASPGRQAFASTSTEPGSPTPWCHSTRAPRT